MMDTALTVTLGLLGTIFSGSFVVLLLLCRYKNLRKRTSVYVKRLARSDLSRSDIELISKEDRVRNWDSLDDRQQSATRSADLLSEKCAALLQLCDTVDLKDIGPADLHKLRHIVQIAHRISEETSSNDSERLRLMESHTAKMLSNVSKALSKMDQQLVSLRESSLKHIDLLYTNTSII